MRGRRKSEPEGVPAVLPLIIAEVVSEEHIVLTVNGQRIPAAPTTRDELGRAISELVTRLHSPTRVEVHEIDGSVWADIITPAAAPVDEPAPPPAPRPFLVELTSDGFVPGEDVAIAIVLRHTSAASNGTARALLDRAETATIIGEVILLGRISGTASIQRTD